MDHNKITLGVQTGSSAASDAMRPAFLLLREQLKSNCTATYCQIITEFAIILRISGSISHFDGEGVQRLRINRKDAYVTTDYAIPESRWDGVPPSEINTYVATAVVESIRAMIQHLVRMKIEVDADKLTEDVDKAVSAFLERAPNS